MSNEQEVRVYARSDGSEQIFTVGTANEPPFEVERTWSLAWLGADDVEVFAEVELVDGQTQTTARRAISSQTIGDAFFRARRMPRAFPRCSIS